MKKTYDVFISYAHEDADIESRIETTLRNSGLDVFVDNRCISGGDNWLSTIAGSIQESCIFLALVSRSYCSSNYSKRELHLAVMEHDEGGLKVIPYMIDNGLTEDAPADLKMLIGSLQWVTSNDYPVGEPLVGLLKDTLRGGFIHKGTTVSIPKALETHCFIHPDRGVAGHCIYCGKNLCSECAAKYSTCICDSCAARRKEAKKNAKLEESVKKEEERVNKRHAFFAKLGLSIALGLLLFLFLFFSEVYDAWVFFVAAVVSFLPFGFSTMLSSSDPRNHPANNPGCLLQLLIGIIAGFFLFIRDLFELILDEKTELETANNERIPHEQKPEVLISNNSCSDNTSERKNSKWIWFMYVIVILVVITYFFLNSL